MMRSPAYLLTSLWMFLLLGIVQASPYGEKGFSFPVEDTIIMDIPNDLRSYIQSISYLSPQGFKPKGEIRKVGKGVYRIAFEWDCSNDISLAFWDVQIRPKFMPLFHWAPHLTPTDNHIMPQHVFRSPAMINSSEDRFFAIVPDLDLLQHQTKVPWFMDMDAMKNLLSLGFSASKITDHVLYEKLGKTDVPKGKHQLAAYILISEVEEDIKNPFAKVNQFLWQKWGEKANEKNKTLLRSDLEAYVQHTYNWAFKNWKDAVWQEFDLHGKRVGAPTFIVNVTQSPNYKGEINEREFRSIWNQAWFNSFRSASGLMRYAMRTHNDSLKTYALKTKELALAFPQQGGFFPGLIATEMEPREIAGKSYWRSKGWGHYYYGNSDRNPFGKAAKDAPYHILDMSFTAFLMLEWYQDLEKDERLLDFARNYGEGLMKIQREDGFFPAWIDLQTHQDLQILSKSPESAMSVTFLLKLSEITKEDKFREAAWRALKAVDQLCLEHGQWEDFETYWSCSRFGSMDLVGRKVVRNNMFKQNTLSLYYLAQAHFQAYKISGDEAHLRLGERVMDELLMWQAVWQPGFIHIPAVGGFGVMNADAEWNDSRQSLFAELILQYGKALKRKDYMQRGIAALRASFVLMYCPENALSKVQWEKRWPFMNERDYGFMMENYGHDGHTSAEGIGIGEFTIYDWGNGAASEAYNRILDNWGDQIIRKY